MRYSRRKGRPIASAALAIEVGVDEARSLVRFAVGIRVRFRSGCRIIAPCEAAVVEALCKKDDVCDGVIDSENDLTTLHQHKSPRVVEGFKRTMVGRTPCKTAPRMLKTSPRSHTMMNWTERASALPRWKF